jgi:hypothetical protein
MGNKGAGNYKHTSFVIARSQAVAIYHPRHCEERSDVAIQGFMDRHAALAMKKEGAAMTINGTFVIFISLRPQIDSNHLEARRKPKASFQ